ncbi:unnamed protein product [Owenia fusiformis]|uniref:beta-N-acetylhexosaminidase n=1 Tax=Owenia fusiformis TaxID=6347 RepID=A0A8S4NZX9_OWEFU|nr:unnamed protein product [Owenia fusiformis]
MKSRLAPVFTKLLSQRKTQVAILFIFGASFLGFQYQLSWTPKHIKRGLNIPESIARTRKFHVAEVINKIIPKWELLQNQGVGLDGNKSRRNLAEKTSLTQSEEDREEDLRNMYKYSKGVIQGNGEVWPEYLDLPIKRAPMPSAGQPWPLPQIIQQNTSSIFTLASNFKFHIIGETCDTLIQAIDRYYFILFNQTKRREGSSLYDAIFGRSSHNDDEEYSIRTLHIDLGNPCEVYPYLGMDESYDLVIGQEEDGFSFLSAKNIWGVLRGLETFSQLVFNSEHHKYLIYHATIHDFPRFQHRGFLLDTSRHFLKKSTILEHIDLMSHNKYNVFHWHIVDDQSFPFQSKTFPNLTKMGAYSSSEIYTHKDVQEIIEYARLRGVRVVPEFDTPGHTESWGKGMPELLTDCGPTFTGPMDPSKQSTYSILYKLFNEVNDVFVDQYIHLGGDECPYECWKFNKDVWAFMKKMHWGFYDFKELFAYFITNLLNIWTTIDHKKGKIVWEDVYDNDVPLDNSTIIQVWKSDNYKLEEITSHGLYAITSAHWYLDTIKYGPDWMEMYNSDPRDFEGTLEMKEHVLGGEACMWGEYIDDNNLIPSVWPRGQATAEKLWSSKDLIDPEKAGSRFEEQRCRSIRRGFKLQPNSGPGSCNIPVQEIDVTDIPEQDTPEHGTKNIPENDTQNIPENDTPEHDSQNIPENDTPEHAHLENT